MKRATTQLFERESKNRAFFQNYRNFTLISDPRGKPPGRPPGKTEEQKPDPWGNYNVRIARGRPGRGWSDLELTDT